MDWLVKEFETLRQSLEEYFGVSLDDTALKTAISEQNEFTRLLTDIADLRKDPDPPFTGTQFQELMLAVSSCPRELLMDDIKKFKADVTAQNKKIDHRARVMVQGGNINDPGFLKVIESQGALVVAERVSCSEYPRCTSSGERVLEHADHDGSSTPDQVYRSYSMILDKIPNKALHVAQFHALRGWGMANVLAAMQAGVEIHEGV